MNSDESNNYVKNHGILLFNNQVILTKPLKVFKQISTYDNEDSFEFKKSLSIKRHSELYRRLNNRCLAVANLVIPIGALVNLSVPGTFGEHKFRASEAYCWSVYRLQYKRGKLVSGGEVTSGYGRGVHVYLSGKSLGMNLSNLDNITIHTARMFEELNNPHNPLTKCKVTPDKFSLHEGTCSNGIHFFLESKLAVNY